MHGVSCFPLLLLALCALALGAFRPDLYGILGLPADADRGALRRAYCNERL